MRRCQLAPPPVLAAGILASGSRHPGREPKRIDKYPSRRDRPSANVCDHLVSGRRQDHVDRETAAVRRAIQLVGEVKARGDRRRARSDWMAIERERQISVSAAVMTFEHDGLTFNLLDTPGPQDFSEDTYRALTAVDSGLVGVLASGRDDLDQRHETLKTASLKVSSRRLPCASIVATTLASWT